MAFWTILVCLVFNLIPTPCKSNEVLDIIMIRRRKDGFMRMTSQKLNAAPVTLETRKIRCHSLGSQAAIFVANVNYDHNSN